MLKAIIFDFDGVIADTEPIHLEAFKKILNEKSVKLTDKDYYEKYLAYDDKTLFETILKKSGIPAGPEVINNLIENKLILMKSLFDTHVELFPGVLEFIELVHKKYVCSIASGALLAEIELILNKFDLLNIFQSITSADEVVNCKPNPEPFIKSLAKINLGREEKIKKEECLVFEDSIHGIDAAKAAGMKCIGIANSYDPEILKNADQIAASFLELNTVTIEQLFIED